MKIEHLLIIVAVVALSGLFLLGKALVDTRDKIINDVVEDLESSLQEAIESDVLSLSELTSILMSLVNIYADHPTKEIEPFDQTVSFLLSIENLSDKGKNALAFYEQLGLVYELIEQTKSEKEAERFFSATNDVLSRVSNFEDNFIVGCKEHCRLIQSLTNLFTWTVAVSDDFALSHQRTDLVIETMWYLKRILNSSTPSSKFDRKWESIKIYGPEEGHFFVTSNVPFEDSNENFVVVSQQNSCVICNEPSNLEKIQSWIKQATQIASKDFVGVCESLCNQVILSYGITTLDTTDTDAAILNLLNSSTAKASEIPILIWRYQEDQDQRRIIEFVCTGYCDNLNRANSNYWHVNKL